MSGDPRNDHKQKVEAKLELARRHFAQPASEFEPSADFVARVTTQLEPRSSSIQLGWVAARMLPVGLALALAMSWAAFRVSVSAQTLTGEIYIVDGVNSQSDGSDLATPSEDLFAWVLEQQASFESAEAAE